MSMSEIMVDHGQHSSLASKNRTGHLPLVMEERGSRQSSSLRGRVEVIGFRNICPLKAL